MKDHSLCPWCLRRMLCFVHPNTSIQWKCHNCQRTYYLCCPCLYEGKDGLFTTSTNAIGHICELCKHYYCAEHIDNINPKPICVCANCEYKEKVLQSLKK
jgi:hypothetical protein